MKLSEVLFHQAVPIPGKIHERQCAFKVENGYEIAFEAGLVRIAKGDAAERLIPVHNVVFMAPAAKVEKPKEAKP